MEANQNVSVAAAPAQPGRSMNSSGSMTIWVVPSLYGLFSYSTTWPARLSRNDRIPVGTNPEVSKVNLVTAARTLSMPVFFFLGRRDHWVPPETSLDYLEVLSALEATRVVRGVRPSAVHGRTREVQQGDGGAGAALATAPAPSATSCQPSPKNSVNDTRRNPGGVSSPASATRTPPTSSSASCFASTSQSNKNALAK